MNSNAPKLIHSNSQDHVGWEDAPFLARLTGVYTPTTGNQANLNLYAFIEQTFSPTTGIPADAVSGRQTYPQSGQPATSYALETSNTLVTVPGLTPAGYANPGPYFEMRLKGYVGGAPVYEFSSTAALAVADESSTENPEAQVIVPVTRIDGDARGIISFGAVGGGEVQMAVQDATAWSPPGPWSGVVNVTTQSFYGSKMFAGVTDATSNANIICQNALAVGDSEANNGYAEYLFLTAAEGAAVTGSAGVISVYSDGAFGSGVWFGNGWICLGTPAAVGNTQNGGDVPTTGGVAVYLTAGDTPATYAGATGMDAVGNIFINGVNVVIGNAGETGTSADGGSYW